MADSFVSRDVPTSRGLKRSRLIDASPFYYGWFVALASMVGMGMTIPGQTAGISLFIDGIIEDLEISRSAVSSAYMVATLLGASVLSYIGRWIDRIGPRRAVAAIAVVFALGCAWMGLVRGLVSLFVGFVMLRSMGQGALSLVSLHAVNIWFVRHRGTAVGMMGVGLALSMAILPPLIERGLDVFTWREMFLILALMVLVVVLSVCFVLFREKPEHFGITPAGADAAHDGRELSLTLSAARRTYAFWMLTLAGMAIACLGTGLMFHHFSILQSNGLGRSAAAAVFIPFGVLTAASNLTTGYLVDRIAPRALVAVMLVLFGGMLVLVPLVATPAAGWIYGCCFGIAQGMQGALMGSSYAHYFGRDHIGSIKGFASAAFVAASAAGPMIYALGADAFGSFLPVVVASGVVTLLLAAAVGILRESRLQQNLLQAVPAEAGA